jgi:hypothetical protein
MWSFARASLFIASSLLAGCSVTTSDAPPHKEPARPETSLVTGDTTIRSAEPERSRWFLAGSRPTEYAIAEDESSADRARPTRSLRCTAPEPSGFGTLMQAFEAEAYRGKRVRFSADVRATDVALSAGLWMRVDSASRQILAFDNMHDRPIRGTTQATRHAVVLDVPAEAKHVALGILLKGGGEVLLSSPAVEIVGKDVPVTGVARPAATGAFRP